MNQARVSKKTKQFVVFSIFYIAAVRGLTMYVASLSSNVMIELPPIENVSAEAAPSADFEAFRV